MASDACILEAEKLAGRQLTDDEKADIADEFERIMRKYRGAELNDLEEQILEEIDQFGQDLRTAAMIEKRNALLNKQAEFKALDYLRNTWSDAPNVGLRAFLGGVATARSGSRRSVAAAQESLANHYVTGLISKLEKEGVRRVFNSGRMDKEIWRAVHELSAPEPNTAALRELPEEAVTIGRILNEYNELARLDANKAGAWIGKLPGRVIKQTHDQFKIRQTTPDEWKAFVRRNLDMERTLEALQTRRGEDALQPTTDQLEKFLDDMYTRFASGEHYKVETGGTSGFKGLANIGRRMSQERILHFKDADASFEYNQRFGSGNLAEGMLYGLEHMAQSTALMRMLGPNAEATLDTVVSKLGRGIQDTGDVAKLEKFSNEANNLKKTLWPNITGEARAAQRHMLAKVSAIGRAVQQMSKLGSATLSAVADIGFYAAELKYQGGGYLTGISQAMGALTSGRTSAEKQEIFGMLGVFHDGMRASAAARFDVSDPIPGRVAKTTQRFFGMSGLRWWTDRLRTNFALASSHRLGLLSGKSWDQLDPELVRTLDMYGIDAAKWDAVRQSPQAAADGRNYLTPEGVDELDDAVFENMLRQQGTEPTASRIQSARDDLKESFRSYFADRATMAVLEPDARTRGILLRGTKPGTPEGEALRHIMLFKSFAATVIQKPIAREIYGRGADPNANFMRALMSGNGEMQGLAKMIAWSGIFGYAALSAKDLAKGREPRDPMRSDTVLAALAQGGGLGIYGDFLFGETKNRFGGNFVTTLAGPSAGTANDLADLYGRMKSGDDLAAASFRTLLNHSGVTALLPGAGPVAQAMKLSGPATDLFYTKLAMDYLILNEISEAMSPGYLRRMERRVKRENDQEFFLPPSEAVR